MTSAPDELEAAVLALPREERARLVRSLIESLDEDDEISTAWESEVRRRLQAYRNESLESVSSESLLQAARERTDT